MTSRRKRVLSQEDQALWARVLETVEPLKRRRSAKPPKKDPLPGPADPSETAIAEAAVPPGDISPRSPGGPLDQTPMGTKPSAPKEPPLPPLAPIDRQERRRLVRGIRRIDGRIDLHGMRQAEAHQALRGFLARSQARGHGIVLVITGKGAVPERDAQLWGDRGILRRVVPQWLRMADLRPLVVGFEEAHQGHGGSGALYVRLRRRTREGPA
jgi:DNA-nicking Smr family endonuclease